MSNERNPSIIALTIKGVGIAVTGMSLLVAVLAAWTAVQSFTSVSTTTWLIILGGLIGGLLLIGFASVVGRE